MMNVNDVNSIIDNCESGLLLKTKENERIFFDDDYGKLKKLINNAIDITYKENENINDNRIKKVYFTLPNIGQASLEVI